MSHSSATKLLVGNGCCVSQEEDGAAKVQLKVPMPFILRKALVDDWEVCVCVSEQATRTGL